LIKIFPHAFILLFFLALAVFENRIGIFQLTAVAGQVVHSAYTINIIQAIESPILQFEVLPGLLFAQTFSLPLYSVEFFFYLLYHALTGIFMYFFIYRYLNVVIGKGKTTCRIIISTLGALIYLYIPYNMLGDNFPELFFMRAFIPLFLLLFMEFIEKRKAILFVLSSMLIAYMTILDPRAVIFVPILAFFFIVLPKIGLTPGFRSKIAIFLSFMLNILLSFVVSYFTITPRITTMAVPTVVGVPFVKEAFRYSLSNMFNTLSGFSFDGTYQIASYLPFNASYYLPIIELLVAVVAFSVFFIIASYGRKTLAIYVFIPAIFTIVILAFFVNFGGISLFQRLFFSGHSVTLPNIVKTVALLFRTPRFTNITLALVYSTFSCLAISIWFRFLKYKIKALRYFTVNNFQVIILDRRIFYKKVFSVFFIALLLISVVSSVVIFTSSGTVLGDFAGERAKAYDKVNRLFGNSIGSSILTVPYSGTTWDFPQAPVGLSESVLRYIYAYALDPSLSTSLLSRNQTEQIGSLLSLAGIKYLVVDEYLGNEERVLEAMHNSSSLTYSGQVGQLFVFKVSNFKNVSLVDPVLVLGGLETYNKISESLDMLSINSSFAPLFMDGPVSWNTDDLLHFGPIFSSPNKSILDLMGPFLVNDDTAIVIPPSQYTSHYDPSNFWSPGFVSDTHQGVWTYYAGQQTGYDWDYSYSPDYGFVFTSAYDRLNINFDVNQTNNYSIFVRTLQHPGNGSVEIDVDSSNITVNTHWNFSSREFVWANLGEVILTKGSHTLSIANHEGSNAVNLVAIIPSEKTKQLATVAEQFYNVLGDLKIAEVSNETLSARRHCFVNVLAQGNYSAIVRLADQKLIDTTIQLSVGNQTYETQVISSNPFVACANGISLSSGEQSIELISNHPFESSNTTVIVYGPQGSFAEKMFSGQIYNDSQVNASGLSINRVSASYYETSILFSANSSFMLVLPQLYTGTIRVSFNPSLNNITYATYPVSDALTGIWFKLPNGTIQSSFNTTFYTEEGRSFHESDKTANLIIVMVIVAGITIDIVLFTIHKKNKQFVKLHNNQQVLT